MTTLRTKELAKTGLATEADDQRFSVRLRHLGLWFAHPLRVCPPVVPQVIAVLSGAAATALASLVLEDVFPEDGGFVFHSSSLRLLWLAVATALLVTALIWSHLIRQACGSAYFLQVHDRRNPQWHADRVSQSSQLHMNVAAFVERVTLPERGTFDLRRVTSSLSAELRAAQNSDNDSTGFAYYPDMLFPVGVALGFDWSPPRKTRLYELNGLRRRRWEFFFDLTAAMGASTTRTRLLPGSDTDPDVGDDDVRAVSVSLQLTLGCSGPAQDAAHIDGYGGFGRSYVVGIAEPESDDLQPVRISPAPTGRADQSAADVVVGAGRALREVLLRHPKAVVVVMGRVPKSVSMPLGWYLGNAHDESGRPLADLWSRLVLLLDVVNSGRHVQHPTWVHHDQPEPLSLLDAHGITVPDWVRPRPVPLGQHLVNLTPHALRVVSDGSVVLDLPAADSPARVLDDWSGDVPLDSTDATAPLPTVTFRPGAIVTDLPEPSPGVVYVVSRIAALAAPGRQDLVFPFDEVRDGQGQVVGCRTLARVRPPGLGV